LDSPPFNIYSMGGMIWVDGLHYSPLAFLLMSAAFRAMDPSLEESATMSGAGVLSTLYRITLKLALPAILATVLTLFIEAVASFEVPALLGLPAGIQVFTSAIYQSIHQYPSQIGLAAAYSVILLMLTTGGIYMQSRISSSGSKYSTVTGKGFRPRTISCSLLFCPSLCCCGRLCKNFTHPHPWRRSKTSRWTATVMCLLLPTSETQR
jgi:iron(III) transport system permease protein